VLELAAVTIRQSLAANPRPFIAIAGLCGSTRQATAEAELALSLGYQAGLLTLAALKDADDEAILEHCLNVAQTIPIIGFYLQPSVGGRPFSHAFWRRFAEIPNVIAIKIAPFNRYQTIDVVRAVVEAGRDDIALYTGNDDNIIADLLTPFAFQQNGSIVTRRIAGGLLGHWGVWTRKAVELFSEIRKAREQPRIDSAWLTRGAEVTDMNAAVFDPAHGFAGCIPGILEVLRRQGLAATRNCLDPHQTLSAGQGDELTRVSRAYPDLIDDSFVQEHRDRWLSE